jgi:hypothetical protein
MDKQGKQRTRLVNGRVFYYPHEKEKEDHGKAKRDD